MLKIRIIPTLLWKDVGLVKGVGFDSWRRVGSVLPAVKIYNTRGVDELVLLDIVASLKNSAPNFQAIAEVASFCFVPLTVGGGIRSLDHIKNLLRAGADKVCINSFAYEDPDFIRNAALYFGSQCIVVGVDVKKTPEGEYECYSYSGTKATGIHVIDWIKKMQELGAGEILLTSIEQDGTLKGYDLALIRLVSRNVNIPVIASGGASDYQDFYNAINQGASAVAAASMFHFTEKTPALAKQYLTERNIPVRKNNTILKPLVE